MGRTLLFDGSFYSNGRSLIPPISVATGESPSPVAKNYQPPPHRLVTERLFTPTVSVKLTPLTRIVREDATAKQPAGRFLFRGFARVSGSGGVRVAIPR